MAVPQELQISSARLVPGLQLQSEFRRPAGVCCTPLQCCSVHSGCGMPIVNPKANIQFCCMHKDANSASALLLFKKGEGTSSNSSEYCVK